MSINPFAVKEQVVIVRQYRGIGITSRLQAFHLETGQTLPARFYNGRIAYQYKTTRVGLTTLRKQPKCRVLITVFLPVVPF